MAFSCHSYMHETTGVGGAQSNIDCPMSVYTVPVAVMFIIIPNALQKHEDIILIYLTYTYNVYWLF